jgi:hypothetical protein
MNEKHTEAPKSETVTEYFPLCDSLPPWNANWPPELKAQFHQAAALLAQIARANNLHRQSLPWAARLVTACGPSHTWSCTESVADIENRFARMSPEELSERNDSLARVLVDVRAMF